MSAAEPNRSRGRRWIPWAKWGLTLVILGVVLQRAASLWNQDELQTLEFEPGWLLASAVLYFCGWLPSVWYWQRLLHAVGDDCDTPLLLRAYFAGHLGKYIPGKATVLLIRAGILKEAGHRAGSGGLTAAYESLGAMASGGLVGAMLAPMVLPVSTWERAPHFLQSLRSNMWLWCLLWLVGTLLSLPFISRLFSHVAARSVGRPDGEATGRWAISPALLFYGLLAMSAGWWLHGLSLACVLQSMGADMLRLDVWPVTTAAAALATVLGFVALFAPGGVGIREFVLLEILQVQPGVTEVQAVATTIVVRLVWLATEVFAAVTLNLLLGRRNSGTD